MSGTSATPWAAALEGLAEQRNIITDAIVSLARVAGVDPAPYLGGVDKATPESPAAPLGDRLRDAAQRMRDREKEQKPARPQSPASPLTNGAGHDVKVLQVLEGGPQAPKAISTRTKIPKHQLQPVMKRLLAANQVTAIGRSRGLKYQLTSTT